MTDNEYSFNPPGFMRAYNNDERSVHKITYYAYTIPISIVRACGSVGVINLKARKSMIFFKVWRYHDLIRLSQSLYFNSSITEPRSNQ